MKNSEIPPFQGVIEIFDKDKLNSKQLSDKIKESKKSQEGLLELFERFSKLSLGTVQVKPQKWKDEDVLSYHPKVIFSISKIKKLVRKLRAINEKYYTDVASEVSKMLCYIEDCEENGKIAVCDVEKFQKTTEKNAFQSEQATTEFAKLKRLVIYTNTYYKVPPLRPIPIEHLTRLVKETSKNVEKSLKYVWPNAFDTYYAQYVSTTSKIGEFQEAPSAIIAPSVDYVKNEEEINEKSFASKDKNKAMRGEKVDFTVIKSFIRKQENDFKLSKDENVVIECAAIRFLFDLYYTKYPTYLVNYQTKEAIDEHFKEQENKIQKDCLLIRKMSPAKLLLRKELFTDEQYNMSFVELCDMSNDLQGAILELSSIVLYTNPIDIVAVVFKTLKHAENFIYSNFSKPEKNLMSFDDFFGIFFPIFSLSPPPNCAVLLEFVSTFGEIDYSQPFQFAYAIFTSAIEFIRDFTTEKLNSNQITM